MNTSTNLKPAELTRDTAVSPFFCVHAGLPTTLEQIEP